MVRSLPLLLLVSLAAASAPAAHQEERVDHAPDVSGNAGGWSSYAQMRADYDAYALANPSIARVEVLGTSVQGREIFGMRISDNVSVEENEPEVVFWASIHGDEFGSAEVAYLYGMDLIDAYGSDPTVTQWIDELEIWVIPLVNPDGHENGTRQNANGVDLNRDLGYNWDGEGGSAQPFGEVETRSLREFCQANNVTLSVTHHCSGNIFLYPWGFHPTPTPDDELMQGVGALYANAASYVLGNSWADYETHGELLDYVYGSHGGLCYTSEMSNSLAQLSNTYARNAAGMDAFLGVANTGLHGLVTDAVSGQPLSAAVWIDDDPFPAYTDPTVGDVHRMVTAGTYDVTVWANGYRPEVVEGVSVPPGGSASFAVALEVGGNHHAFQVTSVNQHDNFDAHQNTTAAPAALGAPDGAVVSLGREGFLVLDLGEGHDVVDGPGPDFTVSEFLFAGDPVPESYLVYGGDAYDQDVPIGAATGTASFDLAGTGLASTRYVRIVDATAGDPDDPFAGVDVDAVTVLNGAGFPTAFAGDVGAVSLATGGTQGLTLDAPNPGDLFLILGSASGTSPGTVAAPALLTIPLSSDAYLFYTLTNPNTFIVPSLGTLDPAGQASATLTVPSGLNPALAGTVLHHAYVGIDPVTLVPTFVSSAVGLTLAP